MYISYDRLSCTGIDSITVKVQTTVSRLSTLTLYNAIMLSKGAKRTKFYHITVILQYC